MELTLNHGIERADANRRGAWHRLMDAGAAPLRARRERRADLAEAASLRTTAPLNLRANPSATAKIRLVIPQDAAVRQLAGARNGYAKIAVNGVAGWAYAAFLSAE